MLCQANIIAFSGVTFVAVGVAISAAGWLQGNQPASQLPDLAVPWLLASYLERRSARSDTDNSVQSQIVTGLLC